MYTKDTADKERMSRDVARHISELSAAIVNAKGDSSKIRAHLLEYENKLKQLEEPAMAINNLDQKPDATSTAPVAGNPTPVDGAQGQDLAVTQDRALSNEPQAPADKTAAMPKNEHAHKHKSPPFDHDHKKDSTPADTTPRQTVSEWGQKQDSTPVDKSLHQNVSESGS